MRGHGQQNTGPSKIFLTDRLWPQVLVFTLNTLTYHLNHIFLEHPCLRKPWMEFPSKMKPNLLTQGFFSPGQSLALTCWEPLALELPCNNTLDFCLWSKYTGTLWFMVPNLVKIGYNDRAYLDSVDKIHYQNTLYNGIRPVYPLRPSTRSRSFFLFFLSSTSVSDKCKKIPPLH